MNVQKILESSFEWKFCLYREKKNIQPSMKKSKFQLKGFKTYPHFAIMWNMIFHFLYYFGEHILHKWKPNELFLVKWKYFVKIANIRRMLFSQNQQHLQRFPEEL